MEDLLLFYPPRTTTIAVKQVAVAHADLVRRLGLVVDAAFLYAGFVPYGVQPPPGHVQRQSSESGTSLCLCRWYTAPQLAHREDAEAAVLLLCATEWGDEIALVIFLTKACDVWDFYLERLDVESLSLSGSPYGPRCSMISRSLAGAVCRGLLEQLRRRNGLTMADFVSLPDDAKVQILKRLRSGDDLARVECTCRDLRRIVAGRDGELWKHMYWHEAPIPPVMGMRREVEYEALCREVMCIYNELRRRGFDMDEPNALSERERQRARERRCRPLVVPFDVMSSDGVSCWKKEYLLARKRLYSGSRLPLPRAPVISWPLRERPKLDDDDDNETGKFSVVQHQKVPRNAYGGKRLHGRRAAGTTHSPSSRYRWNHR